MSTANYLMLAGIGALLVVLIFLAAAEMSLSKMTKPRVAAIADQKPKSAEALHLLVEHPERWINPLLLTVNICQTVQATLTGIVASSLFGGIGVVVGVTLNVVVFFVLAEAVPKTYAVINPDRSALFTARAVSALVSFPPLRFISKGLIGLTNSVVKGASLEDGPFVREQEFRGIIEEAANESIIEDDEYKMIESVIELDDTVVREIMTPAPDVVSLDSETTISDALDVAIHEGFSRLPVVSRGGEVVGVVFTKDLIRLERSGQHYLPVADAAALREVNVVPESKKASDLMREMQANKSHMALVFDEYGEMAGLVSLEDCLEEIVGEIDDEFDEASRAVDDGTPIFEGRVPLEELNDLLGTEFSSAGVETIGGFVFSELGRVPQIGEELVVDGWAIRVLAMEGRRVTTLSIVNSLPLG